MVLMIGFSKRTQDISLRSMISSEKTKSAPLTRASYRKGRVFMRTMGASEMVFTRFGLIVASICNYYKVRLS